MDMDNAAVFLAGSILYALACIVILIGIVIANNIIHKFWKNFGWKLFPYWWNEQGSHARFASQEELERIAPHMETDKQQKDK